MRQGAQFELIFLLTVPLIAHVLQIRLCGLSMKATSLCHQAHKKSWLTPLAKRTKKGILVGWYVPGLRDTNFWARRPPTLYQLWEKSKIGGGQAGKYARYYLLRISAPLGGDRHANQNIKLQNGKYGRALCCSCILSQGTNNVKKSNIG